MLEPRTRMAHLLRRAGFGVAPGEIERRLNDGYEATVASLVESGGVSDGLADLDRQIEDATRRLGDLQSQVDTLQQAIDAAKAAQDAKPK